MSTEKILTLVIPTYNMGHSLSRCLESVTAPEVPSTLEVIVVNDGSTDNSLNIMESFYQKRPDIIRIVNKENGHYGSCINSGLSLAQGKYFRPLDADDTFNTDSLIQLLNKLEKCNDDCIITQRTEYKIQKDSISCTKFPYKGIKYDTSYNMQTFDIGQHIQGDEFNMHCMTYLTSILRKAKLSLPEKICYTDFIYCSIPLTYTHTFRVLDLFLYNYYIGREGQSVSKAAICKNFSHITKVINYILDDIQSIHNIPPVLLDNKLFYIGKALNIFTVSLRIQQHISKSQYKQIQRIADAVDLYKIDHHVFNKFYFRLWRLTRSRIGLLVMIKLYNLVHYKKRWKL